MAVLQRITRYFREDFDRGRDFIATRGFTLSGRNLNPGDLIDKTALPTRRLRQLYDRRLVAYAKVSPAAMKLLQYPGEPVGSPPPPVPVVPEAEAPVRRPVLRRRLVQEEEPKPKVVRRRAKKGA